RHNSWATSAKRLPAIPFPLLKRIARGEEEVCHRKRIRRYAPSGRVRVRQDVAGAWRHSKHGTAAGWPAPPSGNERARNRDGERPVGTFAGPSEAQHHGMARKADLLRPEALCPLPLVSQYVRRRDTHARPEPCQRRSSDYRSTK